MSVYDKSGAQGGDEHIDQLAQHISNYHGVSPELLRFLEGERASRDAVAAGLERVWARLDTMEREQRHAERDAAMERGIGMEARIKQQAAIHHEIATVRAEQRATRTALIVFGLILAAAIGLVILLLVDRYVLAGLARLWAGAGLALLLRGRP